MSLPTNSLKIPKSLLLRKHQWGLIIVLSSCSKSLPSFAKVCTFHVINSTHPCCNIIPVLPKFPPAPPAKCWALEGRKDRLLSLALKCDIQINFNVFIKLLCLLGVLCGNHSPKQHLLKKSPHIWAAPWIQHRDFEAF